MAAVVRAVVAAALMTTQAHGAKEKRAAVAFVTTQGYGDQAALDRVRNVERWLYAGGPVPTWWDIHAKSDLPPPTKWAELGGGNSKRVRATVYAARPVVVQRQLAQPRLPVVAQRLAVVAPRLERQQILGMR